MLVGKVIFYTTALAAGISFLLTPVFRAEVLLEPVQRDSTLGGLASLAGRVGDLASISGINQVGGDDSATSIATLKSRALTETLIKDEGVMPLLFPSDWDAQKRAWEDPNDPPTMWEAFEKFDEKIREVKEDRKTGLVTLAIEWEDPVLAARWANSLVKRVNAKRREEAIRLATSSIAYLRKELRTAGAVELQQAIYRMIETQMKTVMLARSTEEYAFRVIDPAVPPKKKIRPKRRLIALGAMVFGALLGVYAAVLRSKRRRLIGGSAS